jgi:predicted secreted protein
MIRFVPPASVLLVMVAFAGGCVSRTEQLPPPRVYGDVDTSFNRKRMTAELMDGVRINLPATAGTGQTWRIVGNNAYVLKRLSGPTFKPDVPARPDSPGTTTTVFQAVNTGWSVVRMAYMRGDEATVTPENSFEVIINVVPPGYQPPAAPATPPARTVPEPETPPPAPAPK